MVSRMLVPSLFMASLMIVALADKPAAAQGPVARVVSIVVESIDVVDGQLIANALVTLDVAGDTIERTVQIPLNVGGSPGAEGECDILNLAVGPIDLDLLGLVVELDDCDDGPVTVDITAVEGGGLLGDLLCDIAGLLDGGAPLGDVLGDLDPVELLMLTEGLTEVLNEVLDRIVNADAPVTAAAHAAGHRRCDILTLEIPEGLELNLLGLNVDTSGICLDVYAERGPGNLLGNLLCNVTNLLNRGNRGLAVQALLRKIGRILDRL